MHEELPLVIAGTAGVDGALGMDLAGLDHRSKGWGIQKAQGVGGLYIIMSIDQHGGQLGVNDLFPYTTGYPLVAHSSVASQPASTRACCTAVAAVNMSFAWA